MDKKIARLSILCGSILFALIFIGEIFFRIYPRVWNPARIHVPQEMFTAAYLFVAYPLIARWKKMHKIFLYLILPFLAGCLADMSFDIYLGGFRLRYRSLDLVGLAWSHLLYGYWFIGLFGGLMDLTAWHILRKKWGLS